MVSPALNPQACWEFEGEILVLHHPTTISSRYQAMGKITNYLNTFIYNTHFPTSTLWQHQTNSQHPFDV